MAEKDLEKENLEGEAVQNEAVEEQNENVGAAISIFNRNVELFNNHIQIFPNNIVNTMTVGKKAVRPFRDAAALQNFDYRPNFN